MYGSVCGAGGGATATPVGGGPTATPTPTRTPGPTPTSIPGGQLINGGFESGRNVGWTESSARGYAIVTTGTSHAGSWRAWHGGANNETAEISQSYTVPSTGGTLVYWYRISSSDACGYDYGTVRANTTNLVTYNLCSSTASTTWRQGSVSLAAYAGQTISIKFRATTDVSYASSFYVDDVSITTALLPIADPNALPGDQLTKPEPKPAAPLAETEEKQY
jgi:hypothetical protein